MKRWHWYALGAVALAYLLWPRKAAAAPKYSLIEAGDDEITLIKVDPPAGSWVGPMPDADHVVFSKDDV